MYVTGKLRLNASRLRRASALPVFEVTRGWQLRAGLRRARNSEAYLAPYVETFPLVSVCVATYNRCELLMERSLPSILAQDYPRIEVIVVGDGCTDTTEKRVRALGDPRIRFENLPERGQYPDAPRLRWMVAGTAATNRAIEMSQGDLITHLDDDDEYVPGRITAVVRHLKSERAELVWHPFHSQMGDGTWTINDAEELSMGKVTTSSILYHGWFKRILWDPKAYFFRQPGDWNRMSKLVAIGCRSSRLGEPLLRHYKERTQLGV